MRNASFRAGSVASHGLVTKDGIVDAARRLPNVLTPGSLLAGGSLDALRRLAHERADHAGPGQEVEL
jgi:hypothetical protein